MRRDREARAFGAVEHLMPSRQGDKNNRYLVGHAAYGQGLTHLERCEYEDAVESLEGAWSVWKEVFLQHAGENNSSESETSEKSDRDGDNNDQPANVQSDSASRHSSSSSSRSSREDSSESRSPRASRAKPNQASAASALRFFRVRGCQSHGVPSGAPRRVNTLADAAEEREAALTLRGFADEPEPPEICYEDDEDREECAISPDWPPAPTVDTFAKCLNDALVLRVHREAEEEAYACALEAQAMVFQRIISESEEEEDVEDGEEEGEEEELTTESYSQLMYKRDVQMMMTSSTRKTSTAPHRVLGAKPQFHHFRRLLRGLCHCYVRLRRWADLDLFIEEATGYFGRDTAPPRKARSLSTCPGIPKFVNTAHEDLWTSMKLQKAIACLLVGPGHFDKAEVLLEQIRLVEPQRRSLAAAYRSIRFLQSQAAQGLQLQEDLLLSNALLVLKVAKLAPRPLDYVSDTGDLYGPRPLGSKSIGRATPLGGAAHLRQEWAREDLVGKAMNGDRRYGVYETPVKSLIVSEISAVTEGCEALLRAAEEGDAPATLWSPGPVKLETKAARRVQKHLQHDPLLVLVDETVKEEFKLLAVQRLKQESPITSPPGAVGEALGLMSLRRRIAQIQRKERLKTASELIYVMVASMFKYLEVPFIQPLKGGGHVRMDMDGEQLRGLTEIYSMEALELVRDHLFNIVGVEAQAAEAPALRIAMYQAGQVYAMSALFGYYLRRADVRYQLDKIVSLHDAGDDNDDLEIGETRKRRRRPVPRWMELSWAKGESRADVSLKDYIQSFGPDELRQIRSLASAEAQATMELQISALFGDLRVLKSKLLKATEGSTTDEEATEMLEEGLRSGAVESIRISYDNLRRLILEAVAFGSVLFDAEREADSNYDLTPTDRRDLNLG
ncbi:unnamed protein product [Durusdinium trenchii]|uniref:KIF-binding protein n=1 Tax=Durusdinium trenchii TaxID=1381693 RepID=A0ABP0P755_9DINO